MAQPSSTSNRGASRTTALLPRLLALAITLTTTACQTDPSRHLVLFDAHDHLTAGLDPRTIAGEMDRAGVGRIVLMANRRATWNDMTAAKRVLGDRAVLYVPSVGWGWNNRNPRFLDRASELLRSGQAAGIGELMALHYPIASGGRPGDESARPGGSDTTEAPFVVNLFDEPPMRQLLAVASDAGAPVHFHMETTQESVASLERALEAFPKATFIWAHQNPVKLTGGRFAQHARQGDPELVRRLLTRYPNLYADISLGYESLFFDEGRDRNLPQAWRALYEDRSDRFMIGLDRPTRRSFETTFARRAEAMRAWLAQLTPRTAERIACSNAYRILLKSPRTVVEARHGAPVAGKLTVDGKVGPARGAVRIERTLEGRLGTSRERILTSVEGGFRDSIERLPPGAYTITYRALCDGQQPGSDPVALTVQVAA